MYTATRNKTLEEIHMFSGYYDPDHGIPTYQYKWVSKCSCGWIYVFAGGSEKIHASNEMSAVKNFLKLHFNKLVENDN